MMMMMMKTRRRPLLAAVRVTLLLAELKQQLTTATAAGNQRRSRGNQLVSVRSAALRWALSSCWSDTPALTSRKQEVSAGLVERPWTSCWIIFRLGTELTSVSSVESPSSAPSA